MGAVCAICNEPEEGRGRHRCKPLIKQPKNEYKELEKPFTTELWEELRKQRKHKLIPDK